MKDDVLDGHVDMLNAKNGVIGLKTGELLQHDPSYYFTKQRICAYKPNAKHPDWNKALEAIPAYVYDFVHTFFGQCLTGYTLSEEIALVLGGGGRNGKSTICDLTLKVVGRFGVLASPALLTAKDSDHTTEITDLIGKRFALLEEFPRSNTLNVSRLKRVVGTMEISGGRMRQDNQTWDATHTLVITTNHEIYIPAGDDGTWRRLVIINFPYPFVTEPTLPNDRLVELGLRDRLRAGEEGKHEAVLAWLVQGAFAKSLQNEYKASGIQIGKVRVNEFAKIPALTDDGIYTDAKLGFAKSQMIFDHLTSLGFLSDGEVTSKFIPDSIGFSLSLPENLDRYEAHVVELMRNASLEKFLKPKSKRKHRVLNKAVYLSAEFEEFWESISRRSTYRVSLNRDDLLGSVVTAMKSAPAIPPLRIEVTKAEIKVVRGGEKARSSHLDQQSSKGHMIFQTLCLNCRMRHP